MVDRDDRGDLLPLASAERHFDAELFFAGAWPLVRRQSGRIGPFPVTISARDNPRFSISNREKAMAFAAAIRPIAVTARSKRCTNGHRLDAGAARRDIRPLRRAQPWRRRSTMHGLARSALTADDHSAIDCGHCDETDRHGQVTDRIMNREEDIGRARGKPEGGRVRHRRRYQRASASSGSWRCRALNVLSRREA